MYSNLKSWGILLLWLTIAVLTTAQDILAAPFPQRGYIVRQPTATISPAANIGRRVSVDAAQRAAMRMLSRLIRWYPKQAHLSVEWETLDSQGRSKPGWVYLKDTPEERMLEVASNRNAQTDAERERERWMYVNVTKPMIRRVARYNGNFRDVTRYGPTDGLHSVDIDLGTFSSYEIGSRATLRVLARRIQRLHPFNSAYNIYWEYPLPNRHTALIRIDYDTAMEQDNFIVEQDILLSPSESKMGDILVSLDIPRKRTLIRAARHSAMFDDLPHLGAKGYIKGK